jgi:hypothetical protein
MRLATNALLLAAAILAARAAAAESPAVEGLHDPPA